jgi:tetratricopeptide (TPR) repeat protein
MMKIIHPIDDFLYSLFPNVKKGDMDELVKAIKAFYSQVEIEASVTVSDGFITVTLDEVPADIEKKDFRKAVELCDSRRFSDAKPILRRLMETNPAHSDYYRVMGQILFEEGSYDEAIDNLIDALRWDPKNKWALLLMGNVFWRGKKNLSVAMQYYDQVLKIDPEDFLSMNNIGGSLVEQGMLEEAKPYLLKSLEINDKYANSHYALGYINNQEGKLKEAFEHILKALRNNPAQDRLKKESVSLAIDIAKKLSTESDGMKLFREYFHRLEFEGGREIQLVEDSSISTNAKIEFAETYRRNEHILRYKPEQVAVEHLVLHELVHLDLVIQARKEGVNQLFTSTQNHNFRFRQRITPSLKKLKRVGMDEDSIIKFSDSLFNGLNSQAFNAPVDLFIEEFIYTKFPEMRPLQFLSLWSLLHIGIEAVTKSGTNDLMPPSVVSASRIYNLTGALQFKHLYGINLLEEFHANQHEMKTARTFYNEFLEYKEDKEPGEEYELIQNWADDLNIGENFELIDENKYYEKLTNPEKLFESIEEDPLGLDDDLPLKEKEAAKFRKAADELGFNSAVAMYMVGAIRYLEKLSPEKIKEISLEIAMQGAHGYDPKKDGYKLSSVPEKEFSGYQILAWYFVSWKIAHPAMVSQLGLPYEKEYEMARKMVDTGEL